MKLFSVRILALIGLSLALATPATAQLSMGGSTTEPDGNRPATTSIDFFEFLQSGGDAFMDLFRTRRPQPTVDDPRWNRYDSPRATVLTFAEAMNHVALGRDEALPRAMAAFGKDVPPTSAYDLLHVMDRLPEFEPGSIPGKDLVEARDIRRWELFPRGIDHTWAYRALDEPPAGAIVLIAEDGRWRFDDATAEGVAGLHQSMLSIPPRPRIERRGSLFKSIVSRTFTETTFADWIWLIGSIVLGGALAWGLLKLGKRIRNSDALDGDGVLQPLILGVISPLAILAFVLCLAIGSARIELHPALSTYRWRIIEAALIIAAVWAFVSLAELVFLGVRRTFFAGDNPYANMMTIVLRRTFRTVITLLLIFFVMQNIFKWNVGAMLGGAAILGLLVSLAAKDAVKNLFGALTIYGNRPFISGDWIRFMDYFGEVQDVGLQTTEVRVLGGEILAIPNMQFIDNTVENLSQRQYKRRVMNIALTYDTSAEKMTEAMGIMHDILTSDEVCGDHQCDPEHYPPQVNFDAFKSHYLNLRVDYWYLMDPDGDDTQRSTDRGYLSYLAHRSLVNRMVLKRFNDAGLEFAFPTQTLFLADDPDRGLNVAMDNPATNESDPNRNPDEPGKLEHHAFANASTD